MRDENQIFADEQLVELFRMAERKQELWRLAGGALLLMATLGLLWLIVLGVARAIDMGAL